MNLKDLDIKLSELKLPYRNYYLQGGYHEDGVCLANNNSVWEVYYCERGKKNIIGTFDSENDACEYIYCYFKKISDNNRWF